MRYYCGIDLHSTNSVVVVIDDEDRVLFRQRLANDLNAILGALSPFAAELVGVVVESTYNWYWLVDDLMAAGFELHLANPAAIIQYSGLKHRDDDDDAAWLGHHLARKQEVAAQHLAHALDAGGLVGGGADDAEFDAACRADVAVHDVAQVQPDAVADFAFAGGQAIGVLLGRLLGSAPALAEAALKALDASNHPRAAQILGNVRG